MAQFIKCRNKQYRGPMSPRFPTDEKIAHARERGYDACDKFNKSVTENPYSPGGSLAEAWRKGYMEALNYKPVAPPNRAPQGREAIPYGIVNVQKTSRKKFRIKGGYEPPAKEPEFNYFLGYISPPNRTFGRWVRNPPKPKEEDDVFSKKEE